MASPGARRSAAIDPSDLNYPSIAVGDLAGKQTVTRTVTNTTNQASIYVPKVQAPAGFTVKVSPPIADRAAAQVGHATRWRSPGRRRRSARSRSARSPGRTCAGTACAARSRCGRCRRGTGRGDRHRRERIAAAPGDGRLHRHADAPGRRAGGVRPSRPSTCRERTRRSTRTTPAEGPAVVKATVTIPAGAKAARFATFDVAVSGGTDLDLFVYRARDQPAPGGQRRWHRRRVGRPRAARRAASTSTWCSSRRRCPVTSRTCTCTPSRCRRRRRAT